MNFFTPHCNFSQNAMKPSSTRMSRLQVSVYQSRDEINDIIYSYILPGSTYIKSFTAIPFI